KCFVNKTPLHEVTIRVVVFSPRIQQRSPRQRRLKKLSNEVQVDGHSWSCGNFHHYSTIALGFCYLSCRNLEQENWRQVTQFVGRIRTTRLPATRPAKEIGGMPACPVRAARRVPFWGWCSSGPIFSPCHHPLCRGFSDPAFRRGPSSG